MPTDLAVTCITAGLSIHSISMSHTFALSSATVNTQTFPTASEDASGVHLQSTLFDSSHLISSLSQSSEQLHSSLQSTSTASQRSRRKSTESEVRSRRHSAAHFRPSSLSLRQRRLSHDTRDNPRELLQSLHNVASRRRSSSSSNVHHVN